MKTSGEMLSELLEDAIATGEIPYQAIRRAIVALDIKSDEMQGRRELDNIITGIDEFIGKLERFEYAASDTARQISFAVF